MARATETKLGMINWVRTVDLTVGNLHLLGQHLVDHRVQLERKQSKDN